MDFRWPLCIDPQMQAHVWIKNREASRLDGRIKAFTDSDFLKQLELAVQYGLPFLFENVDEHPDPVIDPILEKSFTIQVTNLSEYPFKPNFRGIENLCDWETRKSIGMTVSVSI